MFIKSIERDKCVYLPNKTILTINIYDDCYISTYNQFIDEFELKVDTLFNDIVVNP